MGTVDLPRQIVEILGEPINGLESQPGEVEILLITSFYGKRDKFRLRPTAVLWECSSEGIFCNILSTPWSI